MTWNDITVFQWQRIIEVLADMKDDKQVDIETRVASVVYDMTENQVDSLPIEKRNKLFREMSFVYTDLKPNPQKYIRIKGRRYKCVFDVRKIPAARYIESKHFASDVNGNLNKIAASMVLPMKKTLFGWKVDKYDASKHSEYSQDMLEAPITAVLGSVVFFCQIYVHWIKSSKGYLMAQMMKKGMSKYQAEAMYQILSSTLDGYIKPNWLRNLNGYHFKKHLRSKQSGF